MQEKNLNALVRRTLRDLQVELSQEFDRNFERQAFFAEGWRRRKSPAHGSGHLLVDTGSLRRSIKSRVTADQISFYSDHPAAAIHNDGGTIRVTERMKRFFWARYYEALGGMGRKKDGSLRANARNRRLTSEAEFWKLMALMKTGSEVKIPRRRFLGNDPEVERIVRERIEHNLEEFFNSYDLQRMPR